MLSLLFFLLVKERVIKIKMNNAGEVACFLKEMFSSSPHPDHF